eukprot:4941290-Ditylum_brightwellii.AAC.1
MMIVVPADGGKTRADITCFDCDNKGHFANQCPNPKKGQAKQSNAVTALTVAEEADDDNDNGDFMFLGTQYQGINKNWVLLDSDSTCSIMCNQDLIKNIREVDEWLTIHTYSGTTCTNLKCDVPNYGEAWFHKGGLANILALHDVRKKFRVTYDSDEGSYFTVHKPKCEV